MSDNIVRPFVTDTNGMRWVIHGVDKMPPKHFHGDIENPKTPEEAVAAVRRAINEGDILYAEPRNAFAADKAKTWTMFAPQHVVAVSCNPFD